MACVNMDHTTQGEYRAYIRHLTCKHLEDYKEALDMVLDYVWRSLQADNVRLDLYHYRPEGADHSAQLDVNADLKPILAMNRRGFKWKTLKNSSDGTRFQIMQMNRPTDIDLIKHQRSEPLSVQGALVLGISSQSSNS
jgi:hypothetical protein